MRQGVVYDPAVGQRLDERLVAGLLGELGYSLHRPVERLLLPFRRVWRAIQHRVDALRRQQHTQRAGPFGAERALVHRAAWVALDVDRVGRSWRRRVAHNRRRRTGRCWCRRYPPAPASGAACGSVVLSAALDIGSSPDICRGSDQSPEKPEIVSDRVCRSLFMSRPRLPVVPKRARWPGVAGGHPR